MHTLLISRMFATFPRRVSIGRIPGATRPHSLCLATVAASILISCATAPPAQQVGAEDPGTPSGEGKPFNIRDVFPEGPGRELVLNNCQSCHVLVPILVLRMDKGAWHRNSIEHRERVEALGDEDFEVLYDYLTTTFTPERPIPELPAALLDTWTTY